MRTIFVARSGGSLEIRGKIGDIFGIASSIGQMGKLLSIKEQYVQALPLCIQSYQIFAKLQSPNKDIVIEFITDIREKMEEDRFHAILTEYNLAPNLFDTTE